MPEAGRAILTRLRDLCRKCLTGSEEGMAYGMPTDSKDGKPEVAVASVGKGCIRFSKPEKIDFAVVESLLVATRESAEPGC